MIELSELGMEPDPAVKVRTTAREMSKQNAGECIYKHTVTYTHKQTHSDHQMSTIDSAE